MSSALEIASITVAPPGFINFTLKDKWLTGQVKTILQERDAYGNVPLGQGKRVQIEFVSVNPTGPLHVGHGRGAILGSTLANALTAAGYTVEKEYYVNDTGTQIESFHRSLYTRYQQCLGIDAEMPPDGYQGNYLVVLAREIVTERGDSFRKLPEAEAISQLGKLGLDRMINQIKADLEQLGVTFDVWFNERSLYEQGQYQAAFSLLEKGGHITQKEGATWLVSTALGEDKDNVVVRSDGTPTYFASDIAYHYDKFIQRQFDKVIDIWPSAWTRSDWR